jgi:radical SAM protein with 4Fe4S-binding SPASM domain
MPQVREILGRVIAETDCHSISLSGGEPLLRDDVLDIAAFVKNRGVKVCLLTNGTLLTPEIVDRCMAVGIDAFQVSLLGDTPELHDRMAGVDAFERVVEAVLRVNARGGTVHANFVATAENVERFASALELCVLLGIRHVSFDRFVPGGAGLRGWEDLLPAPDALAESLAAADVVAGRYNLSVKVSTPVLPCLVDTSAFRHIRFGSCAVGRADHTLFCIDPEGNVKVCSHSPHVLGNLLEKSFSEIIDDPFYTEFVNALPPHCTGCARADDCRGGCRSSAHVCYGSLQSEEPYLQLWKSRARKPVAATPRGAADVASCAPELERR